MVGVFSSPFLKLRSDPTLALPRDTNIKGVPPQGIVIVINPRLGPRRPNLTTEHTLLKFTLHRLVVTPPVALEELHLCLNSKLTFLLVKQFCLTVRARGVLIFRNS